MSEIIQPTAKSVMLEDINTLPVFLDRNMWLYEKGDVYISRCIVEKYNKKNVVVRIFWDDYDLCYCHRLKVNSYKRRWILFLDNEPAMDLVENIQWEKKDSWINRFKRKGEKQ